MIPTAPVDTENSTLHNNHDTPWFPFSIPQDAWKVQDADEEIFLLYSQLQSADDIFHSFEGASGLGTVESRQDAITVRLDVQSFHRHDMVPQPERPEFSLSRASRRGKSASKKHQKSTTQEPLEIQLCQDTTALRSRKGDTGMFLYPRCRVLLTFRTAGSVLWRASVHLARLLLSQPSSDTLSLLPATNLSSCHVLELGSGTGLLSIVLAPLVAHYTATDLPSLLPLIQKNVKHNLSIPQRSKISIHDIDWVELHKTPAQLRHKIFPTCVTPPHSPPDHVSHERPNHRRTTPPQPSTAGGQRPIDLIMVVDCIYNPSLIAPLLDTIDYLAMPNTQRHADDTPEVRTLRTVSPTVLVVLELRAADVSREFLHAWLELSGGWEIWSIPLLGPRFAMWVGRRRDGSS